ncbi:MAG: Two component signal transduction histidine kinase with domain [Blastococcus sp.]|nr:Two component signal transduction histidine kinase with domain [Blastococcus sp.]
MTPPDRTPVAGAPDVRVAPVLTAALRAAASGSRLEATLHDIVQAAVRHVGAGFGAMGVLTPDGRRLDRFVVVGMEEEDRERIGRPPTGHGILGLLVAEPSALRLDDLGQHPASTGFPPGHPPMRSFLGVPVRVGEAVFGNLYLTEKRTGGPFTPADVEVAQALAAVAGMAIENARLAERAETRRKWGQAATEMATALLSGADPDEVLRAVSTRVSALTHADMAGVLAPSIDDDTTMTIVAAVGPAADDVEGVRVPLAGTYVGATAAAGVARLTDDISTMPVVGRRAEVIVELTAGYGPAMIAPLGSSADRGLLVTLRAAGREPFSDDDLDLLSVFATQASVVLELARAQQRERRLQVEADRDRIARDLHDHVVQRIFATGLALDRIARSVKEELPELADRISERVDELVGTIARIRSAIFELQEADDASPVAVRRRLGEVVRSVTEGQSLRPDLRIRTGGEDLPAALVHDVVAVVRELVTNVARHADATRVTILVTKAADVRVVVTDDGHGLPPIAVRSGLANLADRAERWGGSLSVASGSSGTEVTWAVPLTGPR